MLIETLDPTSRTAVFESFFETTKQALVEVFGKTDGEAQKLLADLIRKFADAPIPEQNLLLHNDPVALASELAEIPWAKIRNERLEAFNRRRQPFQPRDP